MEINKEAATCAICGEHRGTTETLIGWVCPSCEGVTETPIVPQYAYPIGPQMRHPAEESGPVILTKKPSDL